MTWRTLVIVTAGFLLAADAPRDDAAKKDREKLQGTWKPESGQRDGKDIPAGILTKLRVVIDGDKLTIRDGKADQTATFTLDPSKTPRAIDIKKARGIYQFEGDTLKLCWSKPPRKRPTEFKSEPDSETLLFVLKRVKK